MHVPLTMKCTSKAFVGLRSVCVCLLASFCRRGSVEYVPLEIKDHRQLLVIQLQVLVQDINVSIANGQGDELAEPVLVSASDLWIEGVFRVKTRFKPSLSIKLDNTSSIVRGKQVKLRYRVVSEGEYTHAWEACIEMAQSIAWKHAAASGIKRCEQHMESLHQQEEEELTIQRAQDAVSKRNDAGQPVEEESILGIPTSLISNPVSYLVGGILSSDPNSFCAQCLTPFSFFTRQHQCPSCQDVVCIPCSRHYVQLNGKGPQVKTCDRCFLKEMDNEVCGKATLIDGGRRSG